MIDWGDYTPGPWVFRVDLEGLGYVQGPTHDDGHYHNLGNARLISKAYLIPRLEAALAESAVGQHQSGHGSISQGIEAGPFEDCGAFTCIEAQALLAELRQP